jgi:hypothetical protein
MTGMSVSLREACRTLARHQKYLSFDCGVIRSRTPVFWGRRSVMLSYPHPVALDAGGLFRCGMLTGHSWQGRATV